MPVSRVVRIICYSAKGIPGHSLEKVNLMEDMGMEGDYHATGGERQLTVISQKAKDWIQAQEVEGFCFMKFKENIIIDGMFLENLPDQGKLIMGEVILELTPARKKCYAELCRLDQSHEDCALKREVRFAKVISGGIISVGMKVTVSDFYAIL